MGVADYGSATDPLTTLPAWAASVSAALEGSDSTITTRINERLPVAMTEYTSTFAFQGVGMNLGAGGSAKAWWCRVGILTFVRFYAELGTGGTIGNAPHSFLLPPGKPALAGSVIGDILYHQSNDANGNGQFYKGELYAYDDDTAGNLTYSGKIRFGYQGSDGKISAISPTLPFSWVVGDFIRGALLYQIDPD